MAIKPLEDRVVVKLEQAEQTTASGLVIPETAKEKPQEARVVASTIRATVFPLILLKATLWCSPAMAVPR